MNPSRYFYARSERVRAIIICLRPLALFAVCRYVRRGCHTLGPPPLLITIRQHDAPPLPVYGTSKSHRQLKAEGCLSRAGRGLRHQYSIYTSRTCGPRPGGGLMMLTPQSLRPRCRPQVSFDAVHVESGIVRNSFPGVCEL